MHDIYFTGHFARRKRSFLTVRFLRFAGWLDLIKQTDLAALFYILLAQVLVKQFRSDIIIRNNFLRRTQVRDLPIIRHRL
jgi:hypothetical protein